MSAFEDFIQNELPKRGYLENDVSVESVIIRRGAGPRQFSAVALAEGQVLGMQGGELKGVTVTGGGGGGGTVRASVTAIAAPSTLWSINHGLASENVIIQVFDETKTVMIPDEMRIVDSNHVEIQFTKAQTGIVRIIFLD